jgi:signal transduction histidine kinase
MTRRGAPRIRRIQILLVLGVLLASVAAAGIALRLGQERIDANRAHLVNRASASVQEELVQARSALLGVRGLFGASDGVTQRQFARFAAPSLGSAGLLALVWTPPVPNAGRAAFEREHGLVISSITRGPKPAMRPAGVQAVYHPVLFMAPLPAQASALIGLDLSVVPGAVAALERVRDSGRTAVAPPIGLEPTSSSLLQVAAVYRAGAPVRTVAQRRAALIGYAGAVYRVDNLAEHALAQLPAGAQLQILDGGRQLFGPESGVCAARPNRCMPDAIATTVDVGGRPWELRLSLPSSPPVALPGTILAGGVLLAALVALLFSQGNRRERDLRRADDELRRQDSITRAVLDAAPYGIRLADLEGRILIENPASARLTSTVDQPLQGTVWEQGEAIADSVVDPAGFRAALEALRNDPGLQLHSEFELAGADRVFHHYSAPVRVGTDEGPITARLFLFHEVTDERRMERAKDEFIALASHELRTPLTSILGYLEVLREGEAGTLSSEQARFLDVVARNAERLLRLVNDLLAVARADAGRLGLEIGEVDLAAVAREAVQGAERAAEERGIALSMDLEAGSLLVGGDRARLEQVVDNLVSNAVKFTPPGGDVTVRLSAEGDRALLEVADTGMGIPRSEQDRLFQRFYRTTLAIQSASPGTGLGLAISKMIVDAHGGTIDVESEEGAGSVFRVRLPLEPANRLPGHGRTVELAIPPQGS